MKNRTVVCAPSATPRLSAHEIAALMLLDQAPVAAESGTLDLTALREAGLAELIESKAGGPEFSITRTGQAVLRILSAWRNPDDETPSVRRSLRRRAADASIAGLHRPG
ncbi:hypothetical protein [Burkholderia stagnalis]|uniref:hypothetical protein n=1 Tax=Burkholderia stagnalis TaxID=1503054 RepID=UPI0007C7849D|nr:hypothetical protein [Burkholderia stagnalis]